MAGRPTKYSKQMASQICEALRDGNTRTDTCAAVNIDYTTFLDWLEKYSEFSNSVTQAEAECARMHVKTLRKASEGYSKFEEKTVTKTVFKKRKYTIPAGSTLEDGTTISESMTIEEEVPVQESYTERIENREFDWRAALEWLKRRRRIDWGDKIDISKLDDDTLLRLLAVEEEKANT